MLASTVSIAAGPARPRLRWPITIGLGVIVVLIALVSGLPRHLEFERAAVDAGQWWRLLTGHLVHCNVEHLAWDLGAFVVLGMLCERRSRRACAACLGLSALAIGLAVWLFTPLESYRGLSGLDSALFALLSVLVFAESRATGDRLLFHACLAFTVGFTIKVAIEVSTAQTLFVDAAAADFVPVPLAHAVGAMIGALCGLIALGPRHRFASVATDDRRPST